MTVLDAVKSNDRLKTLVAMRDKIAQTMDSTDSGRDIAALSKRLAEVMAEIDAISPAEEETPLAKRRNAQR